MLFDILPVLLMFISLGVIVLIVGRRLPEISSLKVEDLVEAQSASIKRQLLLQRLEERFKNLLKSSWGKTVGAREAIEARVKQISALLHQIERRQRFAQKDGESKVSIEEILNAAMKEVEEKKWSEAEQLYLDVLRYDELNRSAYVGLGLTYKALEQYEDAKESLMFALKLDGNDADSWLALAEIQVEIADIEGAVKSYHKVVELRPEITEHKITLGDLLIEKGSADDALVVFEDVVKKEPSNPRGLDRLLEVAIVCQKKRLSQATLRKLKKVNPENNKIADFEQRVANLA